MKKNVQFWSPDLLTVTVVVRWSNHGQSQSLLSDVLDPFLVIAKAANKQRSDRHGYRKIISKIKSYCVRMWSIFTHQQIEKQDIWAKDAHNTSVIWAFQAFQQDDEIYSYTPQITRSAIESTQTLDSHFELNVLPSCMSTHKLFLSCHLLQQRPHPTVKWNLLFLEKAVVLFNETKKLEIWLQRPRYFAAAITMQYARGGVACQWWGLSCLWEWQVPGGGRV